MIIKFVIGGLLVATTAGTGIQQFLPAIDQTVTTAIDMQLRTIEDATQYNAMIDGAEDRASVAALAREVVETDVLVGVDGTPSHTAAVYSVNIVEGTVSLSLNGKCRSLELNPGARGPITDCPGSGEVVTGAEDLLAEVASLTGDTGSQEVTIAVDDDGTVTVSDTQTTPAP